MNNVARVCSPAWSLNAMRVVLFASLLLFSVDAFCLGKNPLGCWFRAEQEPAAKAFPAGLTTVLVSGYFQIYYSASDPEFRDGDGNGIPDILEKQKTVLDRSRHFLTTELGWKIPATQQEMNRPRLAVYFISAPDTFTGTTRSAPPIHLVFNKKVLFARDFASHWIHQLAHAAELQYRPEGEYWFYEATAGWMEGQFDS